MNLRYLLSIIVLLTTLNLGAQDCVIAQDYNIVDDSTVVASITIAGAMIDDLSDPLQGLCGVNLEFEHDAIGDIEIFLQAPSGQIIQLIGPAGMNTELTQFHYWDIGFVPCSETPMPDPFRSAIWTNLENWFNFTNAVGTYYPYSDCLEDLDTGPISGVWNFIITDAAQIYDGVIHEIELIFCDENGISCEACEPYPGNLNIEAGQYCESEPRLLFDAVSFPPDSIPDPLRYDYEYVLVSSNIILDYLTVPDLRALPAGMYEICGLSILKDSQIHKPAADGVSTFDDLKGIIDNNLACAVMSDTCVQLEIIAVPSPENLDAVICAGEEFEYKDQVFTEEGTYFVSYGVAACDSVTILDLRVVDVVADITPSDLIFSCTSSEITLTAGFVAPLIDVTYMWSYENPDIILADNEAPVIVVNQAGEYTLIVESESCRDTVTILLDSDGSLPVLSFNNPVIDCNNPTVTIDLESSVAATYNWDGPGILPSEINIEDPLVDMPGFYSVTVTDQGGLCTTVGFVEVLIDTFVETPIINTTQYTCVTDNAMIDLEFVGSGNTVAWVFNNIVQAQSEDITVSQTGEYTAIITAENGCTLELMVDIFEEFSFPESNFLVDTLDCLITTANIEHLSVEPGHTYNWEGPSGPLGNGSSIISTSDPGIYYVTVTSDLLCEKVDSFEIVLYDRIPDLVITADSLGCSPVGGQFMVSTSLNIVSYDWFGPGNFSSDSSSPVGTMPGIYILNVITDTGCAGRETFYLDHLPEVPNINLIPPPLDCDTDAGMITITGGNANLTYNWSGPGGFGSMIKEPIISEPGLYVVTITDTNTGCVFFHDLSVDEILAPAVLTFETEVLTCDDAEATIYYNSNTVINSSSWETVNGSIVEDKFDTLIVDQVGTYYVNTINESGCVGRDSIVVTEDFELPDLTIVAPIVVLDCTDPKKRIRARTTIYTDVTFNWEGPTGTTINSIPNPLIDEPGWYYVTAVRDNGCFAIDSVEVRIDTIPPLIDIIISQDGIINCLDSIVELSSTVTYPGTFDFEWTGPGFSSMDADIEIRDPGMYTLTAIGANGCEAIETIEILEEFIDPIVDAIDDVITCTHLIGELEVQTLENNLMYDWTGPSGELYSGSIIQVNEEGMYIVTVTNDLACKTIDTAFLEIDTMLAVLMPMESETLDCDTQSAALSINADRPIIAYHWEGPNLNSDLANPIIFEGGIYLVTVTADNDCTSATYFEVVEDKLVPFLSTEDLELNCWDSRVELTAPNTAVTPSYFWDGPGGFTSTDVAPLVNEAGTYYITVTDANGCAAFDSIVVSPNLDEPDVIANDAHLPCNGEPLELSAFSLDPIEEYRWIGPNNYTSIGQVATITEPGEYVLLGIGTNGCISLDTVNISDEAVPPFFEIQGQMINCYEPSVDVCALFVDDDMGFEWSDGNAVIGNDTCQYIDMPGEYFLTVTGTDGCTATQSVIIDIDTLSPMAIISPQVDILCNKQEDILDASASSTGNQYAYQWETTNGILLSGETTVNPLINGIGLYSLEVTDLGNGCTDVASILVEESISSLSNVNLSIVDPSCIGYENGFFEITSVDGGVGPYEFSLDGEIYSDKLVWNFLGPDLYTLYVRDAIGCIYTQDVAIGFGTEINVSLGEDQTVNLGDSIYIEGLTNIDPDQITAIYWNPGEMLPCQDCLEFYFAPSESVSFELVIEDENGCIGSDLINIYVDGLPEVYVPNIFSPNGDNINDEILIFAGVGVSRVLDWRIIDRWGNLLHHAENFIPGDYDFAWDGNFRGEPVNPNVFVFMAEIEYTNGDTKLIKGSITLLR